MAWWQGSSTLIPEPRPAHREKHRLLLATALQPDRQDQAGAGEQKRIHRHKAP